MDGERDGGRRLDRPAGRRADTADIEALSGDALVELLERYGLDLGDRVTRRIRARAYLLDPDGVFELSARHALVGLSTAHGDHAMGRWLDARIDEGIDSALQRDVHALLRGPSQRADDNRLEFLSVAFGVPRDRALAASVAFNGLPYGPRRLFVEMVVGERTLAECERAGWGDRDALCRQLRTACEALALVPGETATRGTRRLEERS